MNAIISLAIGMMIGASIYAYNSVISPINTLRDKIGI